MRAATPRSFTAQRVNSCNGYRRREWGTRAGTVELSIPKGLI